MPTVHIVGIFVKNDSILNGILLSPLILTTFPVILLKFYKKNVRWLHNGKKMECWSNYFFVPPRMVRF